MTARNSYLCITLALALAACSKSDPPPAPKTKAPQAAAPSPAPIATPAKPGEIDDGLKERLARQEAAARMFESKVLIPPAPQAPKAAPVEAKPAPAAAPQPAPIAAAAPPKAEPPKAEPKAAPARAEPPKAEPAKIAPAPAPSSPPSRTDVAAARPAPAPALEPPATRLVSRVDPEFPREAASAGVAEGSVKARMTLDAGGNVTRVEIVEARPRRVFDRAVVRALSQWRYNDGAAGRTVDMEVAFNSR